MIPRTKGPMTQQQALDATGEAFGVIEDGGEITWYSTWMEAETARRERSRCPAVAQVNRPDGPLISTPLNEIKPVEHFEPKPNVQDVQQDLFGGMSVKKHAPVDGVTCLELSF